MRPQWVMPRFREDAPELGDCRSPKPTGRCCFVTIGIVSGGVDLACYTPSRFKGTLHPASERRRVFAGEVDSSLGSRDVRLDRRHLSRQQIRYSAKHPRISKAARVAEREIVRCQIRRRAGLCVKIACERSPQSLNTSARAFLRFQNRYVMSEGRKTRTPRTTRPTPPRQESLVSDSGRWRQGERAGASPFRPPSTRVAR